MQAGITMAMMIVPQSLAMATLAGLPPSTGLYTSWVPHTLFLNMYLSFTHIYDSFAFQPQQIASLVYAFMGSSPRLSVGPDVAVSVFLGQTLESVNPENFEHFANILAFMVSFSSA